MNLGKRVFYICDQSDVNEVESGRENGEPINPIVVGQVMPATVVADWGGGHPAGSFNILVHLDGQTLPLWKTSVVMGNVPGTFLNI